MECGVRSVDTPPEMLRGGVACGVRGLDTPPEMLRGVVATHVS